MNDSEKKKTKIEKTGEDLFNFAIDREDVKTLTSQFSEASGVKRGTVEYELQLLKIISVGWSISYYLEASPQKTRLTNLYWEAIREFSKEISETTGLMIGQNIDYFQVLKDRLDTYVNALNRKADAPEPAVVIGPEFAGACGNPDDVYAVMAGSRLFIATVAGVREYLETIKLR